MAELDTRNVEQKIIDALNGPGEKREPREYLGYSGLGNECLRASWYSFRWVYTEQIEGRMLRLFGRGFQEEKILAKEFATFGAEIIYDQKEVIGFEGHVKGHIDGIITDLPDFPNEDLLFEAKTYNDKRFKKLEKLRLRQADYTYYVQLQMYMGHLQLDKALFIATNKNDDHRYIEIVDFDIETFDKMEARAIAIVTSDFPPDKVGSGQSTWFQCRYCKFKWVCHHGEEVDKNCRTCQHGTIINDGKWKCANNGPDWSDLNKDTQLLGCINWNKLETL